MSFKTFSAFIFAYCIATNANAIVNLDKLHLASKQPGFNGGVSFGLSGSSGHSEQFRLKSALHTQWNLKESLYYISFNYGYGESSGVEDQNKGFLHARKITSLSNRLAWEIFSQIEHNKFARLNFRGLLGGGSRFSLSHSTQKHITHLGLGGFYSREYLIDSSTATDNGRESTWRANIYFLERFALTEKISIFETLYLQPSFTEPDDYRVLNILGLKSDLSDKFSLSFTVETTHDSKPPQNITKTDWNYVTSLEYEF